MAAAMRWYEVLLLTLVVIYGVHSESCQDPCAHHKNGSFYCANSHCTEFPDAPDSTAKIILQHNDIIEIRQLTYPQLVLLNLTENSVSEIGSDTFYNTPMLQTLLLAANRIERISYEGLRGLEQELIKLDLSRNQITELKQDPFNRLKALEYLDLSFNLITELLSTSVSDIPSLTWLNLMGNQIMAIDRESFLGLGQLQHVDLRANEMTEVGEKSFYECIKLEVVDLYNNSIHTIQPRAFAFAEKLHSVYLQHNKLEKLNNGTFDKMADDGGNLEVVFLDWNPLKTIPAKVFPRTVSKINMDHLHELEFIDAGVFAGINFIKELMINHNPKFGRIHPGAFLDEEAETVTPVQALKLTNNSLTSITKDTFDWHRVSYADLRLNPWNCDCNMKWMVEEDTDVIPETLASTQCKSPGFLAGQSLSNIPEDHFSCNMAYVYKNSIMRAIMACVCITIIIIILAVLYKNRNRLFSRCTNSDFQYKNVAFSTSSSHDDCEAVINQQQYRGGRKQMTKLEEMDNDEL